MSQIKPALTGGWLAAALLIAGLVSTDARATLIAADSFFGAIPGDPALGEYDQTTFKNQFRRGQTNGAGQDPTIPGFIDPWSGNVTSGSLGVAQWTAEVDGIFADTNLLSEGGRARFAGVDNLQRRVQRQLSPYTPADTYYYSLISQVTTGDTGLDGFVGIGFTNTGPTVSLTDANLVGGSDLRGFLVGPAANGSSTDYVVRHVGSSGVLQNDIILPDIIQNDEFGSPFVRHTVLRIDFNDDPLNPAGNSKLTVWQDPTDLASESAATASVTPIEFRTFALGSNADITHLTMTGIDYSRPASFDEPRFGTTWEAVTPLNALPGDFDADTDIDADDIDLLTAAIAAGSADTIYDLDGSTTIDAADLDEMILNLLGTFFGDTNLDLAVDLIDLSALATNFGQTSGWAGGNFNTDTIVDLIDLSLLATNFGAGTVVLPEPSMALMLLGILPALARRS
ncbi:MAG: hypothetical protein RIG82_10155 [Phycisphaeraceae bacterium]